MATATTTSINGKLLGVKMDGTLIAAAKGCKLTYTHELRDTTTKDDNGVKSAAEGMTSWKVDCDGLVVNGNWTTLFTAIKGRTKVLLSFTQTTTGDRRWGGYAYLTSLDQDGPDQASITYSASFEGTGALTETECT